ncbi:MAG: hypothetical protein C0519_06355 [Hyphomicrobium sp.]|nr:hypothetical protein [Hyphomicrobium sp.]
MVGAKPQQNGFTEFFSGRFRDDGLNETLLSNMHETRQIIEVWRVDCNQTPPHTSLNRRIQIHSVQTHPKR